MTNKLFWHHWFVDYALDSLGPRNFEHLAQSLALVDIGPSMSTFGDGADGGREARWDGPCPSLRRRDSWDGYGVVQAKCRLHTSTPAENLKWLVAELKKELGLWADPDSKRIRKPDFILFVTNVRLSPGDGGGKEKILDELSVAIETLNLPIIDFCVWDYDDIRARLDESTSIRTRYAAFLTTGDVITELMSNLKWKSDSFRMGLLNHAARTFMDDNWLTLTQAGAVSDHKISISDVAIDVPVSSVSRSIAGPAPFMDNHGEDAGVLELLLNTFNEVSPEEDGRLVTRRAVLIGGPGQGKSTITQLLAQMFRASFIRGTPVSSQPELAESIQKLSDRCQSINIPNIAGRRWPCRIILTEFADYLTENPSETLVGFIAKQISMGSALAVRSDDLIHWLGVYPWILFIDGLDEVPSTSNRINVVRAVRDFLIEAATLSADVAVVATTRPQGYNDEFPPDKYIEFTMSPLEPAKALEYAERLIALRHGPDSASYRKISQRVRRAVNEPTTARLMETPLQVTILTVLLEKLGHAPRQRWRLFSQYYKVITQREQEKGGELAELLQRHENDVEYLHRRIGSYLQNRSSTAGDTSATIAYSEFQAVISRRLLDSGYEPEQVLELQEDFARLVTDRLVFLALVTADKVGFELRSLQEFMAADYVLALPEKEIIPSLRSLAANSFWRNVALFIAGGVFAERETLSGEVIVLCRDMNLTDRILGDEIDVLRPGSDFAIDLLLDSACTSPIHQRGLAEVAIEILLCPGSGRLAELAAVSDAPVRKLVRKKARESSVCDKMTHRNRIHALASLHRVCTGGEDSSFFEDFVRAATVEDLLLIAVYAIGTSDRALASTLNDRILEVDPIELLRALSGRQYFSSMLRRGADSGDAEARWFDVLVSLFSFVSQEERVDLFFSFELSEDSANGGIPLAASIVRIRSQLDSWEWFLSVDAKHENWLGLVKLARFCESPNEYSLGVALTALADIGYPEVWRAGHGLPWILLACVENAKCWADVTGKPEGFSERLRHLSDLATAGELGNEKGWLAAEDRWVDNGIDFAADSIMNIPDESSGVGWDLPVPREFREGEFILSGLGFSAPYGQSVDFLVALDVLDVLLSAAERFSVGASHYVALRLVSFYAGVFLELIEKAKPGTPELDKSVLVRIDECWRRLSTINWETVPGPVRAIWRRGSDATSINEDDIGLIMCLGHSKRVFPRRGYGEVDGITKFRTSDWGAGVVWPLARLEMILDPSTALNLDESAIDTCTDMTLSRSMRGAWALANASVEDIVEGRVDDQILELSTNEVDSFNADWLLELLRQPATTEYLCLAVRSASLLQDSDTDLAYEYWKVAVMRYQSVAVTDLAGVQAL